MPRAGEWKYYAVHPFTGEITEELHFSSYTYTIERNGSGNWSAEIEPLVAHTANGLIEPGKESLNPGATIVVAERGGTPQFGGWLWVVDGQIDANIKIGGQGFWAYWRENRRRIRSRNTMTYATGNSDQEITWTAVDYFRIVTDIMDHISGQGPYTPYWDSITMHGPSAGLAGVTDTFTLWAYEDNDPGAIIERTANSDPGFDFTWKWEWSSGTLVPSMDLWYPRAGRRNESVAFETGKNISLIRYTEDATKYANQVIVTGAGSGDNLITASANNSLDWYPTGIYPVFNHYERHTEVDNTTVLAELATRSINTWSKMPTMIEVELIDKSSASDTDLDVFSIGDSIITQAAQGWIQIGQTSESWFRIETINVTVDNDGKETVKLRLTGEAASLGE